MREGIVLRLARIRPGPPVQRPPGGHPGRPRGNRHRRLPIAAIRHPSYLGLLLGLFGWALVFRSAIAVLVSLLMIPPLVARMNSEEALLESEFGPQYADYCRRTWRLLPFLY